MADICEARIQGIVPSFNNAVRSGNLDNEEKAYCHVKLNVETNQQGDDGKYRRKVIEVSAFRKQAITLSKCAKAGAGLILECDILESRPMTSGGEPVTDAAGKQVYTGQALVVRPYGIHFQRDYSKRDDSYAGGQASRGSSAPAADASDPLSEFFGAAPANNVPADVAAPKKGDAFDGFDFM